MEGGASRMPRLMVVSERHQGLLFAGDDQNDYTAPEPIGWIDLEAPCKKWMLRN